MTATRTEVKIALGGPDIAKWAAQRVTGHGFDPSLNVGEGICITGSSWSRDLDYDDPRQLVTRALDRLLTALGDPRPTMIRVEVLHR